MNRYLIFLLATSAAYAAAPSLTIYNGGFAVVRDVLPLNLQSGENEVLCAAVSPFLDPASVMLRDPAGKADFRIVMQKFRADVLTEESMLARFEGQTIPFQTHEDGKRKEVMAKIVRAGYWVRSSGSVDHRSDPIFDVDGKLSFTAPGSAIFPRLPEGEILKPELRWRIAAPKPLKTDAELVYLTDGLFWQADYNAILAEDGNISQFIGWITLENDTGLRFENSDIKLVAGNVTRNRGGLRRSGGVGGYAEAERVIVTGSNIPTAEEGGPVVKRRTFEEYHEYTLPAPVTLTDREMTQIELVRGANVKATRSFIYDGAKMSVDLGADYARLEMSFGTESTSKVALMSEFKNDTANHLGVPLPQGLVHFYRPDPDGHLQFTGDSNINNTPKDEIVRATTGFAFDLVGERRQTDYKINEESNTAEETFEIKIRNHRKDAAEVRVWEHPCRWRQWEITSQSQPFKKIDQTTFEFVISVPPNGEKTVNYTIRYSQLPERR
ncbi:MAG TPA: hypothetical protein VJ719_12220 [Chthoniobacterales bacterium]|nr:hypothetical protein [Chthoniobacterales bacterium]